MGKICAICNAPSGMYPLCMKCFKLRDAGKVAQCPDCKTWYKTQDGHKCEVVSQSTEKAIHSSIQNICRKCGQPSGKYDICYDCYRKKTDEDLKRDVETLIESEKDSGIDIRKKWGNAKIKTAGGLYVRSHAECRIADWLYNHDIRFEYERMVLSKTDRNKFLLSDFFIPICNIYIEYWGYKDKETYNKRRAEKQMIYKENGFIMEDMEDTHLEVLDDTMKQLLARYLPDDQKAKLYSI